MFLLPYVMPVAGTVLLVDLLFSREGLVNRLLLTLGLPLADWLQSPAAFWVMLILYLWKSTGYAVVLLLAGLMAIPPDHYAVAQVEGANWWQAFRYITMPQMWYALFIAFVFSLINAFKCFREIFLVGGEHPHPSVYMLQHFINNSFENLNYQRLSVASVLLFLVLTLVLGVCALWVLRKEAARIMKKLRAVAVGLVAALLLVVIGGPFVYVLVLSFFAEGPAFSVEGYYRVFLGSQEYLLNFWRSLFLCAVIVAGRWFCRCSRAWALPSTPSPGRTSGFSCCWW